MRGIAKFKSQYIWKGVGRVHDRNLANKKVFSRDEERQEDEDKNIQSCICSERDGYFFAVTALQCAVTVFFCSDGFFLQ